VTGAIQWRHRAWTKLSSRLEAED